MRNDSKTFVRNLTYPSGRIEGKKSSSSRTANDLIEKRLLVAWWWSIAPQETTLEAARSELSIILAEAVPGHSLLDNDDPAIACNAAITTIWRKEHKTPTDIDRVVSRVAYSALCGDRACAWLVSTVLRRCARDDHTYEETIQLQRLADAWRELATRQKHASYRVAPTKSPP
jgi:hypothetical protein